MAIQICQPCGGAEWTVVRIEDCEVNEKLLSHRDAPPLEPEIPNRSPLERAASVWTVRLYQDTLSP